MTSPTPTQASTVDDPRVPLGLRNGAAIFLVSLAGLMMANLAPLIMSVLEDVGFDVIASGNILTWALLASAVVGLATSRFASGPHRRTLASIGLIVAIIGFLVAAFAGSPGAVVTGFIIGGAGVGTAISSSGAAIAAVRNPNRVSATSGVVNRLLVMVVLALIPTIGLAQITVFGALALLAAISLAVTVWLPDTPDYSTADIVAEAPAGSRTPRTVMLAGIGVLIVFPVWGTSEDSVWTLAPVLGNAVGLSEQSLGFALSAAAGVGAAAMLVVTLLGTRIGRAVPLAAALLLGGITKIWIGMTTDALTLAVLIVVVNTIYAFAFVLFIATAAGLDARGSWSGPLIGAYIVGSSFAPIIGAWVIESVGIPNFGLIMGIVSFVVILPTVWIARVSTRVERTLSHLGENPA
ncbi:MULTISPECIES: MFS transporter [Brevibacterium]|uniref:Transporter n=1 Tax=Brevibacterium casei TaxID=33889 RepID=A0AB34XRM8_9MICO|nr:MFS transporter [Brevibacterium casei]NJE66471.1 MFS transporter [Brevibacterium sp. LS14]KZE17641.1 transporter [Brevibacterium casei]MCT1447419.1 MFS transporter [Brevibacterium casei]MCT2183260.1 MFS transporter [Brevibacterium casei]MDH5149414.1 MFS transporter [Brevibacterium casei]